MANIYYININDKVSDNLYNRLMEIISVERRQKIERLYFEDDKKRSLFTEILIRYVAVIKENFNNSNIRFKQNKYGKLYFQESNNCFFNVSHSGEWVVCGWSNYEIGIDIEEITDRELELSDCFLHPSEYRYFENKEDGEKKKVFYSLWTLKESYIKFRGMGFYLPLNSFWFNVDADDIQIFSTDVIKPHFKQYSLSDKYKISVCLHEMDHRIDNIRKVTIDEVIHEMINIKV
jgi:4'-phosphopantetheinyl transferase